MEFILNPFLIFLFSNFYFTILHTAAENGNVEIVNLILSKGNIDINAKSVSTEIIQTIFHKKPFITFNYDTFITFASYILNLICT